MLKNRMDLVNRIEVAGFKYWPSPGNEDIRPCGSGIKRPWEASKWVGEWLGNIHGPQARREKRN